MDPYDFLKLFITINHDGSVSMLAKLALNRELYRRIRPILARKYAIMCKWAPIIAEKYHKKLIDHPIRYDHVRSKIYQIANLEYNSLGIKIPMIGGCVGCVGCVGSNDNNIYAIAGIKLLSRVNTNFACCLYIGSYPVFVSTKSTVIDIIEHTEEKKHQYEQPEIPKFITDPGEYVIDINIPLDINPLTIHSNIIPDNVYLSVNYQFREVMSDNGNLYGIVHNTDCVLYDVSSIIVKYLVVDKNKYDWSKYNAYGSTDVDLTKNMYKYSIVMEDV